MKRKIVGVILVVLPLVLSCLAILPVHSTPTATMYVEPASIDGTLDIGDTFTATIMFKDFVDLWTWQVQIFWNQSVINCTGFKYGVKLSDNVYEVLAPGREYLQNSGGLVPGKLLGTASSLTSPPTTGVTGEAGVGYKLVELYFKVVGYGSTITIDFQDPPLRTFWLNSESLVKQPCNFIPGTVQTVPEFPAAIILPILMILTLITVILGKLIWSTKRRAESLPNKKQSSILTPIK